MRWSWSYSSGWCGGGKGILRVGEIVRVGEGRDADRLGVKRWFWCFGAFVGPQRTACGNVWRIGEWWVVGKTWADEEWRGTVICFQVVAVAVVVLGC